MTKKRLKFSNVISFLKQTARSVFCKFIYIIKCPFRLMFRFFRWWKSLRPFTPHRSFRRTLRRDYSRGFLIPSYPGFTAEVIRILWSHKKSFGSLVLFYTLLSAILVGVASQSWYTELGDLVKETNGEAFKINISQIGQAWPLFLAGLAVNFNQNLSQGQQLVGAMLILLVWLTTIWLLRAYMAGHNPNAKDGLYRSGAPIVPTLLLGVVLILQTLPATFAFLALSVVIPTGLASLGIEAMLFWVIVLLLITLTIYWATSTLIALVIVTLPGVYPLKALKSAHELVRGRRLPIVIRLVWLLLITFILWALILMPIIVFDLWLSSAWDVFKSIPVVPFGLLLMSSATVVWVAAYIYLLYRKLVDNG